MKQESQQVYPGNHCQTWLSVLLLLSLGFSAFADESVPCLAYSQPSSIATIADDRLTEISGLVSSRSQPGILWMHNDSGDGAMVYAIDLTGQLLARVQLLDSDGAKMDAVDCEDIALGPGLGDGDFLFLADIGDNAASRETIRIYRFPEPHFDAQETGSILQTTAECDVIEAIYPDAPRDAETLLVDPITGDIVVISKDFIRARAYRVPSTADDRFATLEFLFELPWGFITGGDISPDGLSIILRGYWNAEIWKRSADGTDWWSMLAEPGCAVSVAAHDEPQGEAIGFSADGTGYFSVSEGTHPSLHFYRTTSNDSSD